MTELFQYQPLDVDIQEIRLVRIEPSEKTSAHLGLTVEHFPLASAPPYCALSYTWGAPYRDLSPEWDQPSATHTIHLNGFEFQVRWNLHAAMTSLSKHTAEMMWIDALCIDQSNISERNQQVQMMGSIYKKSKTTFIWLGPNSDHFSSAWSTIKYYFESKDKWSERLWRGVSWRKLTVDERAKYQSYAEHDLNREKFQEELGSLADLLKCPWFRRVWVVQEAALSCDSRLFWGHDAVVTWDELCVVVNLLEQHRDRIFAPADPQVYHSRILSSILRFLDAAKFFRRIDGLRGVMQRNDAPPNSILVFLLISGFRATDRRDHVYSVMGMLPDITTVRVDYNLEAWEIMAKTTRALMESSKNLYVLSLCEASTISDLPSWAIDFTVTLSYFNLASPQILPGSRRFYSASGKTFADFHFEDKKTLIMRGFFIGEISFVGNSYTAWRFWEEIRQDELSDQETASGMTVAEYNQKHEDAFIKSFRKFRKAWLRQWFAHEGKTRSTIHSVEKYRWTQEENVWSASQRTLYADTVGRYDGLRRIGKDFDWAKIKSSSIRQETLHCTIKDRVFAATLSQQFCRVRNDAEVGDVLFIANGAETPYVLRPTDDGRYRFGNNCYVHGFMDGEVLDRKEELIRNGIISEAEVKIV